MTIDTCGTLSVKIRRFCVSRRFSIPKNARPFPTLADHLQMLSNACGRYLRTLADTNATTFDFWFSAEHSWKKSRFPGDSRFDYSRGNRATIPYMFVRSAFCAPSPSWMWSPDPRQPGPLKSMNSHRDGGCPAHHFRNHRPCNQDRQLRKPTHFHAA